MSEEQALLEVEQNLEALEEEIVEEEITLSPAEEKALAGGWKPRDEWEGDPDEWVSAHEFNRAGEMMSRIQSQTGQLKQTQAELNKMREALKNLSEHNKKLAEKERELALSKLKKERDIALEEQDLVTAENIRDKMEDLKSTETEVIEVEDDKTTENTIDPVFETWIQKPENSWYNDDVVMQGAANALAAEYVKQHPEGTPEASMELLLEHVTGKIKEKFPQEFGEKPIRRRVSTVAAPNADANSRVRTMAKKHKYTTNDLDDTQKAICKTLVETGALPDAQTYIDQLVDLGELG